MQDLLSPKQAWSIRRAVKRLNIWEGSVRSSKTIASIFAAVRFIPNAPPGNGLLAGVTTDSLKRNIIHPILDMLGDDASYHPGLREMRIFGRTLDVIGASDERSERKIRGSTVAFVLGDEITLWPETFFQMALSRMSVTGARFFGTTNPDNPNHWLKKNYLDRASYLDLASFHFKIDDNPYLDKAYVEALKKEYIGLWYKRFIDGDWCVAEGAIYDFFDEKVHTIDYIPEAITYDVSIDYGTTNPCVFLLFGSNPNLGAGRPKTWSEREFYYDPHTHNHAKTDGEFAKDFAAFIAPIRHKLRGVYCDPSAESFQLELKSQIKGLPWKETENDVLNGIRTSAKMMKNGDYAIYRYGCPKTIEEKYAYSWNKKKQMLGVDEPLKANDHCSDTERYYLHSKYGMKNNYDITRFSN